MSSAVISAEPAIAAASAHRRARRWVRAGSSENFSAAGRDECVAAEIIDGDTR